MSPTSLPSPPQSTALHPGICSFPSLLRSVFPLRLHPRLDLRMRQPSPAHKHLPIPGEDDEAVGYQRHYLRSGIGPGMGHQ